MRFYTVHARTGHARPGGGEGRRARGPSTRLVPEGFSRGAFLLGPLWLLWRGPWAAAAIALALVILAVLLLPGWAAVPAVLAVQLLAGFHGRDLERAALARRGHAFLGVVAGADEEAAWLRLLGARPDLAAGAA